MSLRQLTCSNCGSKLSMELAEDQTSIYCPYCGEKVYLASNKREYTINKNININKNIHERYTDDADIVRAHNEGSKDSRQFKQTMIALGCILLVLFVMLFLAPRLNKAISESEGKISAGYYGDLVGKDYKTVQAHFEAAGFTNIELIDLDDAGLAFWTEGGVESISVGGSTYFQSSDYFDPETKIVISYH